MVDRRVHDPGPLTVPLTARRFSNGVLADRTILLAREVPYTLFVNEREILSIATLPTRLKELFVGFLVSEGVLTDPSEVIDAHVDHGNKLAIFELEVPQERLGKLERKGMLTSGCAGGLLFSVEAEVHAHPAQGPALRLSCSTVLERMRDLDLHQGLYSSTRGVHAASVGDASGTMCVLEDLGRHNAVDKVIGWCFLNQVETRHRLLLTTGRITSEVVTKAARSGFPVIISRSSASGMAAGIARNSHIDLVTYVRAGRFNYFPHGGADIVPE